VIQLRRIALPLIALVAAGCASQAQRTEVAANGDTAPSAKDKAIIEQRAIQRWELLINHQAAKAYDFLSPGFRATKSREAYAAEMNNRPVQWSKVLPYSQKCEKPTVCEVSLQIDANVNMPGVKGPVSSVGFVTETWIKTGGKWYILPNMPGAKGG